MKKDKARAGIYGVAGIYFFYLAYTMFQNRAASEGNEHTLVMVFSGVFILAGIVILIMAYRILKQVKEEENNFLKKEMMLDEEDQQKTEVIESDGVETGSALDEEETTGTSDK